MPENSRNLLEIRSDEVQEILTRVPHWMIRWGNLLFLLLIVLVLVISWFVKYPDLVVSEVVITSHETPQKEYAQVSGKIEAILVEDNQEVQRNTPLAVLENTADFEDVFLLKSMIESVSINGHSFYFPIDSLPVLFLGEIETQYALFESNYRQYVLNKELRPFSNESAANLYTVSSLSRQLETLKSQRDINEQSLELAKKSLDRQKILFEKGINSVQQWEDAQYRFKQEESGYISFESSITQINEALNNARKNLKGTEYARIKEETILFRNVLQSFNQLKNAILGWERKYVLKSDIIGKVSFLNFWNINQTVNQGDLVFTVIPNEYSGYIAKLKTPAKNSGKIELGQRVNIKLENYSDLEFGVLNGRVDHISLIPDRDGFYLIDVQLPSKLVTSYNLDIEFRQEMKGSAEIITEDLRLMERTLFHVMDIFKN